MAKKFHTVTVTPVLVAAESAANQVLFNLTEIPHAVGSHGGSAKLVSIVIQDKGDDLTKDFDLFFFRSNAGGNLGTINAAVDITDANLALNKPLGNVRIEAEDANDVGDYLAGQLMTVANVGLIMEADSSSGSIFVAARAVDAQTKAVGDLILTFGFETL